MTQYRNILIIKPGAIGDLLHLTPVVRTLRGKYPDSRITVMVGSRLSASIFQGNPDISETLVFERKGRHRSFRALLKFALELRKKRFDLIVNFQRSNLRAWLLILASLPCRILVYHPARSRTLHAVVNHLETLAPLGVDAVKEDPSLAFFPSAADDTYAGEVFRMHGLEGRNVALFNPGTAHEVKCWPVDRFASLGNLLEARGIRVVIVGSPAEKELAATIIRGMATAPVDLTGCSLGELGALCRRASVMVTGDTGPMHIASAMRVPIVGLFGPISPRRSGPVGEGHRIILREELDCCPCNSFRCRNPEFRSCMNGITVDEVFTAVLEAAR